MIFVFQSILYILDTKSYNVCLLAVDVVETVVAVATAAAGAAATTAAAATVAEVCHFKYKLDSCLTIYMKVKTYGLLINMNTYTL